MNTRVQELFHRLADLSPEVRRRYYIEHNVDSSLRKAVDELLRCDAGAATLLENQIGAAAEQTIAQLETNGQQCGPYRLLTLLGRGGMGSVYLGERTDGEIELRVAVKLLRPGIEDSFFRQRFLTERQILASLAHPNIARLLDAGHREDGQPYLVMEYVEGRPIDEYAEELTVRQILALFVKACSAVSYLHRNLVIHRDLKPGNLLVTKDGEPKLLDFGIAKLVDLSLDTTMTSFRMLTPEYASPEQVMGGVITTASDVYSMGAILYRLLTGERPRSFAQSESIGAIVRAIESGDIVRPSKWAPALRGDLEMILLKALRNEPQARYSTIDQLSDDLENFLASQPIRARQHDAWYRAGKFLRRHWLRTVTGAVSVIALLAGALLANYQRAIAQERFLQVRQLAQRFLELHDDVAHLPGSIKVREKMVSTALDYLDRLSASAGNDAALIGEVGQAYEKVAQAQGAPGQPNLGRAEDALESFRKAVRFETRAAGLDGRYRLREGLIRTELAYLAMLNGHFTEARANVEAAGAVLKRLQAEKPADPQLLILEAQVATNRGDLGWYDDQHSDQSAAFREGAHCYLDYLRLRPSNEAKGKASRAMDLWADSLREARRFDEALTVIHQAAPLLESLLAAEPDNPLYLRQKMETAAQEGYIYDADSGRCLHKPAEAAAAFRRRLEVAQKLVSMDPNNASARLSLAIAEYQLSWPLVRIRPRESLRFARDAVRILDEDLARNPRDRLLRSRHARALRHLAYALRGAGNSSEAANAVEIAIAAESQLVAESPQDSNEREQLEFSKRFSESLANSRGGTCLPG